jgi:hypothetical protein
MAENGSISPVDMSRKSESIAPREFSQRDDVLLFSIVSDNLTGVSEEGDPSICGTARFGS